jgi:hypothetical protein
MVTNVKKTHVHQAIPSAAGTPLFFAFFAQEEGLRRTN